MKKRNYYKGIEGAYFFLHGSYADPEFIYQGWSLNAVDIFEIACSEQDDDYEPDADDIECALMDSQAAVYDAVRYEIEHDAELKDCIRNLFFEAHEWQGAMSIDQMIDVAKDYVEMGRFDSHYIKKAMYRDIRRNAEFWSIW